MGWLGDFLWQDSGKFPFHRKTNLAAIVMTGMVTALFIVLTVLDRESRHQSRYLQDSYNANLTFPDSRL